MVLIKGDCLEQLHLVQSGSVHMVLADLPYNITPAASWDCLIPMPELWAQLRRVTVPGAPMVFFAATPFNAHLMASNPRGYRYDWIWVKNRGTGGMNAAYRPMRCHEHILVFYDKRGTFNPQKTFGHKPYSAFNSDTKKCGEIYGAMRSVHKGAPDGSRFPRSVLEFPMERGHHSVQKPVALLEYLIRSYTNPGELVLDPTCGSGSTGVAAIKTGRQFIGIEKSPEIYEVASARCAAVGIDATRD